jgi:hypothetical protein
MMGSDDNREEFIARASSGKVKVARIGGFWWSDNWITPVLAFRVCPTAIFSEIVIGGWNPDVSGMENNQLWVGLQNRSHGLPRLLRNKYFEFIVPVVGEPAKPFELTIATWAELEGDKQDVRSRGCHLYEIRFQ